MLGWIKMSKRVKVRESITELFVYRVSVYMKDNETLNNTYKVWVEYINNTVKTESPGFTDCLQERSFIPPNIFASETSSFLSETM